MEILRRCFNLGITWKNEPAPAVDEKRLTSNRKLCTFLKPEKAEMSTLMKYKEE